MCSHPKEDSAYSYRSKRFSGSGTRPDNSRRKTHILARIHSLLSFLNSHPSPNFRNIRAMPTDPITITSSEKAAKRIKAIVSMFLSFKIFVECRESNPKRPVCRAPCPPMPSRVWWRPHSSHDVMRIICSLKNMQNKNPNMTFPSAEGVKTKNLN